MNQHECLNGMSARLHQFQGRSMCRMQVNAFPGMGASTTVREFYERERAAFDGPLIWLCGQDNDGEQVPVTSLLRQALLRLGVPETELPATHEGLKVAYDLRMSHEKLLVVVDGSPRVDILTDLVPAHSPESAIVVITPERSRRLISDGFAAYQLETLGLGEAVDLFRHHLGRTAEEIDQAVVEDFVKLCWKIPLLIGILAAQLVGNASLAGPLLRKLRASQSMLLKFDEKDRIPAFLRLTYLDIPAELRQAYRRCSLIPGESFTAAAAAVVLQTDVDDASILLHQLADRNLLIRAAGDRFEFHDVIRIDAQEKVNAEEGEELSRELKAALTTWFVGEADPRDRVLSGRWRAGRLFEGLPRPELVVNRVQALDWFGAELSGLAGCVREAPALGQGDAAVQLVVMLFKFLHYHHDYDIWIQLHDVALGVVADDAARMQLHQQRGAAYLAVGDLDDAERDFKAFARIAHAIGDKRGQQSSYEWLGKLKAKRGDFAGALKDYERSWEVVVEASAEEIEPEQQERMCALLGLQRARVFQELGDRDRTELHAGLALEYFHEGMKEPDNRAKCLHVRGNARSGAPRRADLEAAAELFRSEGAMKLLADVLTDLGAAATEDGDLSAATAAYEEALALYEKIGSARAEAIRAELAH